VQKQVEIEGRNGTKWLNESSLKLPKMMRDMFIILCENASWDIRKMEEMENIHVDITRLTIAFQAIELITVVWTSKMQVVRTMEILQRTEDDVVNHLKNISTRKKINRQINIEVLPDNQMTPKKR
ncbi:14552_t:CDS:2, partial [Funneliformis geosporum]